MNLNAEEILSLIEVLLDEKISSIPIKEGKRGIRGRAGLDGKNGKDGKDGKDFVFSESKKEILNLILENKESFKGPKGDRGERGPKGQKGSPGKDGLDGLDGKSFEWDDYKEEIFNKINEYRLKFSDLTEKEKEELKGERGPRGFKGVSGKDGKDFIWEEHEHKIFSEIEKNSLTFEKLTEEQKQELRGPRGLRGQRGKSGIDGKNGIDGKDFIWEEHQDKISNLVEKFRLKFDELTDDQKKEIRGERGPRGQRGRQGIQGEKGEKGDTGLTGAPGIKGLDGRDGKDGKDGVDGKDAPIIIDIKLEEWNNYIYFVFLFDDGTKIETKKIERPVINQMVSQIVQSLISKSSFPVSDEGVELTSNIKSINFVGDLVEATSDVDGNVTVTVLNPPSGIVVPNVTCNEDVYLGAAVYMDSSEVAQNAIATSIDTSNVLGIVEAKQSDTLCTVRVSGKTESVFSGLDVANTYYLSDTTPGALQTAIPTQSGHVKLRLGQAFNANSLVYIKGEAVIRL